MSGQDFAVVAVTLLGVAVILASTWISLNRASPDRDDGPRQ